MVKVDIVKTNNLINFKNTKMQKSAAEDSANKQNAARCSDFMDFQTFRKTALYGSIDKTGASFYDFNDFKEYNLKNNIKLYIDKSPQNGQAIEGKMLITPKNTDVDPLKLRLLADMMNINIKEFGAKDDYYVSIGQAYPQLLALISSDNKNFKNYLEIFVKTLTSPVFSEEILEQAKNKEKEYINSLGNGMGKAHEYLYNKNKEISAKDIDNVKLDDIKNFYYEIFANSQVNMAIMAPDDFSSKNENIAVEILSKLPTVKPFDEKYFPKSILPQSENKTFSGKTASIPSYSKFYVLENDAMLKNEITTQLLDDYFFRIMQSNYDKKIIFPQMNYGTCENEGMIMLGATLEDSQKGDMDSLKQAVNSTIEKLINEKISKELLEQIKKGKKYELINDYKKGFTRIDSALKRYKDSDNSLKSKLKILDSITPEDLQTAAKNCFTKPYIEAIEQ